MRFLQADLAHLRNRYDEAAEMFEELGAWAEVAGQAELRARCVWGHGHVLRHQGRDLERALGLFNEANHAAGANLFVRAYSVTGATGIKVYLGSVPSDEEEVLATIEHEIASTSSHDAYMLEVWKSQAQVAWHRGERNRAFEIVEAATARALALNDRLLYNLYFEHAEFARLSGDLLEARDGYRRVLEFGKGNRDRNLVSNAMLGLALVDMSSWEDAPFADSETIRASVIEARATALEADIQITADIATTMAAMLDAPKSSPESLRLILM